MNQQRGIGIVRERLNQEITAIRAMAADGRQTPTWTKNRRKARRHLTQIVAKELGYGSWWMPFIYWLLSAAVRKLIEQYLDRL